MKRTSGKKSDVLIVGSGPGGATLARDLSAKGKTVTILEWGKDNPNVGKPFDGPFRFFGGFRNRKNAFVRTANKPVMGMVRGLTVGGSTLVYGGLSWDPPNDIFQKYGINLSEEVDEIKNEICIKPLDSYQMGPVAKMISTSAKELGYDWREIDRLFNDPGKFQHTSYFMGDKTGARWDARGWVFEAVGKGANLMTQTFCKKIIIDNNKAVGVQVVDKNGEESQMMADTIVLSAGGIGTPQILQNSGIRGAGRNLFNDPYVIAIGYVDKAPGEMSEVPRQAGIFLDGSISLSDMAIPSSAYRLMALGNFKFTKINKRSKAVSIVVEIRDEPGGELGFDGLIRKPFLKKDKEKLERGKEIARKILNNAGAKDIWFTKLAGVHPAGTCKIGDIVDSDLKTQIENLYISDASVIPESCGIPPVLTILSLSRRLSKHIIRDKWKMN